MDNPPISQDDLFDVMEMTDTLENFINETLEGNQSSLALSALLSASINCMFGHCRTLDEVIFYRNIFVQMLDASIKSTQIKKKDK